VLEATSACPSFSWSAVAGAEAYLLALFETEADGAVEEVFTQRIEGAALSWTPPRDRCLAPGREYAWVVRAERDEGEVVGPWSAPLRFRVPGVPSPEELRAALEVLERWRRAGGAADGEAGEPSEEGAADNRRRGSLRPEVSTAAGEAAIRGENLDGSGSAYGLFGITHSPEGAAVVARNEAGGADLVLDGEAQGEADTILTQGGVDRRSEAVQYFDIANSGGGGIWLTVAGEKVDTQETPIHWTRLTGVPAGFADSVDNDTTYTAGNQLALAGTQFNVLEGPGSGLDADTLDGAQGASYQARVVGTCPEGQAMRGVLADGSVVCYEVPVPPRITTVADPVNLVGSYLSLAIGADGFPVISYHDATAGSLVVAKCNDAACAGGDETISPAVDDAFSTLGWYTSLAIGTDGLPVISYQHASAATLWVAKCNDPACDPVVNGPETTNIIDPFIGDLGFYTSLAIGADGFPVISYQDATAQSLKVAKCDDAACAGFNETVTTVDDPPGNAVGEFTSLAIGADGYPVISYWDGTAGTLKVAKCDDAACTGGGETITTVDDPPTNTVGTHTSIAIGADGYPVIGYRDETASSLKVARCGDAACAEGGETITTVDDPANQVGFFISIAIGADGYPVISHFDATAGTLRVVKCNDAACAGGDETITTVDDPANEVGRPQGRQVPEPELQVLRGWRMGRASLRIPLLIAFGAGCATAPQPASAATCDVPSASYPTVGAALREAGCSPIQLATGSFPENVLVERDVALQGAGSDASFLEGYFAATGATVNVTLAALTVDGTASGVAGCWREVLSATGGAQVATGPDVVVLQTSSGGSACRLFADGFESGGVLAWSGHVPP